MAISPTNSTSGQFKARFPLVPRDDAAWLDAAIRLGMRNLGQTAPNPAVGALIVRDRVVVGRGITAPGGRPHAETVALAQAGAAAKGATAYVSLEPCAHHGRTPPCADALINAGVSRVVYPIGDPDPKVAGQGRAMLEQAGIEVTTGLCADHARLAHAGHILSRKQSRPFVTLKLAVSADGYIAAPGGKPVAITKAQALAESHMMRATHDAILIGAGTMANDDPLLTCRLPGMAGQSPIRIVLDPKGRTSPSARMFSDETGPPVWVVGTSHRRELPETIEQISLSPEPSGWGVRTILEQLAQRDVSRLLVEGGSEVAWRFLNAQVADEIHVFTGSVEIGAGGVRPFRDDSLAAIGKDGAYTRMENRAPGDDRLEIYRRNGLMTDLE